MGGIVTTGGNTERVHVAAEVPCFAKASSEEESQRLLKGHILDTVEDKFSGSGHGSKDTHSLAMVLAFTGVGSSEADGLEGLLGVGWEVPGLRRALPGAMQRGLCSPAFASLFSHPQKDCRTQFPSYCVCVDLGSV